MALDQVDVMRHFGFDRFAVVGQDRGGRVAHRMALDHPDEVTKAVFIDIVPTYYLYTHVTIEFVQAYFHWFNYLRPSPMPENVLLAQRQAQARRQLSPRRPNTSARTARPKASTGCAKTIARALRSTSSTTPPTSIADPLPAERALGRRRRDGQALRRARDLARARQRRTGKGMPGGHNMQEGAPEEVLAELRRFLKA